MSESPMNEPHVNKPQLGTSEPAGLERGYRRLLAAYPRWFRRENEDEILAVLMACAQDGQRRPSGKAAADLIKGATRMWMRPRPGQPHTVFVAIRLISAGALAELGCGITSWLSFGSARAAIMHADPGAWHLVQTNLIGTTAETPLLIALWLWMARANSQGRQRGRVALAVYCGVYGLAMLAAISGNGFSYQPANMAAGLVQWLVALAAVTLVFNPASSRHYRTSMRNGSSLA